MPYSMRKYIRLTLAKILTRHFSPAGRATWKEAGGWGGEGVGEGECGLAGYFSKQRMVIEP